MHPMNLAQDGVLSDPTSFAEYLTLQLHGTPATEDVATAMAMIENISKSIGQKDPTAEVTITTGFSAAAFASMFPDAEPPAEIHDFIERSDGPRHFPSTGGDIFFMVKSQRIDLAYQASKYLLEAFAPIARATEDIVGFGYLDNRDLIDFVDGTENPALEERSEWVLRDEEPYPGSSYLAVQRYSHRSKAWNDQTVAEQEAVVGRTKMDDIELDDDTKQPFAHNEKSKVEVDGVELKMFRQNRAWGNASEHGTMFVGFAKSLFVLETSMDQMVFADEDGHYDRLLDFVDAHTGANYFIPPKSFMESFD